MLKAIASSGLKFCILTLIDENAKKIRITRRARACDQLTSERVQLIMT